MIGRFLDLARTFGVKRLAMLVLAPGLLSLAFDAAVGHVADATVEHPTQISAIVLPIVGSLVLFGIGLPRVGALWFGRLAAAVGWVLAVTGAAGTFFHVKSFLAQFDEVEAITFELVRESLGVSPPVFAPSAFIGIGALLVLLASPRLRIEADPAAAPAPAIQPAA